MKNTHPFIVENGGAIFIPEKYCFSDLDRAAIFRLGHTKDDKYHVIELGIPYTRLREALSRLQDQFPGKIHGFGDLSVEEVAHLCDFSTDDAVLAKRREYDEPLVFDDDILITEIQEAAKLLNLQVIQGGRFHHLIGPNDKGKAVLRLIAIFRNKLDFLKSFALGDSHNDLPMLAAVDTPILLPKANGQYDLSIKLESLTFAENAGPKGWCEAVLKIISNS